MKSLEAFGSNKPQNAEASDRASGAIPRLLTRSHSDTGVSDLESASEPTLPWRRDFYIQPSAAQAEGADYRLSILSDILLSYPPPLSRLASYTTLQSNPRGGGGGGAYPHHHTHPHRAVTPNSEQRHPGKEGARITRTTREWEPDIAEEEHHHEPERNPSCSTGGVSEPVVTNDGSVEGFSFFLLIFWLCFIVFVISVDQISITTAIPFIMGEFHSSSHLGWYGSSYLIAAFAFQPLFGRVFMLFDVKWSYLLCLSFFILGSLLSALSPNSTELVIGRAFSGLGSAGILTGSYVIVATAVPLKRKPLYAGIVGLMFALGATVSPLIGGAFSDIITWRWCFWVSLPAATLTSLVIFVVFQSPPLQHPKRTFGSRIADMDLLGNVLLLSAFIMLLLAFQYVSAGLPWDNPKPIGLLCGFGSMLIVFMTWQWWKQDGALIPPVVITQRTVAASCLMTIFVDGARFIHIYFLPIWFQTVLGNSGVDSGIAMIPYLLAAALFSLISDILVTKIGYFTPLALFGSVVGTVGSAMISRFNLDISTGMWIGFEILTAAGFAMPMRQAFTAVQVALPEDDVALGTAAVAASQSLGGALFISVANAVFQSRLRGLATADTHEVLDAGILAFNQLLQKDQQQLLVAQQYNMALQAVFIVAIPLGGLACLACCFMEWRLIKPGRKLQKQPNVERKTEIQNCK